MTDDRDWRTEIATLNRLVESWRKEAGASDETVDEASALLVDFETWASGSTTFPGDLLAKVRLFLGPQRCSACKNGSGARCTVHAEPEVTGGAPVGEAGRPAETP